MEKWFGVVVNIIEGVNSMNDLKQNFILYILIFIGVIFTPSLSFAQQSKADKNLFYCKHELPQCDKSLLSQKQILIIKQAEYDRDRNLLDCKMGKQNCDLTDLTESQRQEARAALKKNNTQTQTYSTSRQYSEPSTSTRSYNPTPYVPSSEKTVTVRSYYRKDGTFVRGHTRSRRR